MSLLLQPPSTRVHQVSDAIQPSHPLSSPSPPAFNLSRIRVFSNESVHCIRWPKDWSFSFSIVISFSRIAAWAMEPGMAGLTGNGLAIQKHRSSQGFMGCLYVEVFMKLTCHQRDLGGLFPQGLCPLNAFIYF